MFEAGDRVKVVDFSTNYPNTPIDQLTHDHPYRRLGEGECIIINNSGRERVSIENLSNGLRNTIYSWRCVLTKALEPDWEI